MRMSVGARFMEAVIALAAACCASVGAATPEQAQAAKVEIEQIQAVFLNEVHAATNLSKSDIEPFMPGGRLYGRDIPEFHRLTPIQLEALRRADNKKKAAISGVRQKYGIDANTARSRGSRF